MSAPTLTRAPAPAPDAAPAKPQRQRNGAGVLSLASATAVLLVMLSLRSVLSGWDWFGPCLTALVVAVACGELGRRLRGPALLLPLITPVGLLLLVTAVGAGETAWLGFIPRTKTPDALGHLVRKAFDDISVLTTPAPPNHGLELLAAAGVFAVAALTDLLAVTLRRPALAVVPLATLLIVAATIARHGVGWVTVGAGVVGWLVLLAVDGRLREREWGRPLAGRTSDAGTLGGTGGRVALVALLVGLVLPTVLQTSTHSAFRHTTLNDDGTGDGVGGEARIGAPLVTLRSRLHDPAVLPVATYYTTGDEYLRTTSLDVFDGTEFTLMTDKNPNATLVKGDLGSDTTEGSTTTVTTRVTFDKDFHDQILSVPYSPVSADIDGGKWVLSPKLRSIFTVHDSTAGVTVDTTSHVPDPTAAQLRALSSLSDQSGAAGVTPITAAQLKIDLALPSNLPSVVRTTARTVVQGKTDRYDQALALQAWFTDPANFTYDLTADIPEGLQGFTTFLSVRRGYCEQFASTFVAMARSLGIPSRVAVGFTAGKEIAPGVRTIDNHDAHAWPEVYFPGQGWVRFEPTPRDGTQDSQPTYAITRAEPSTSASPSPVHTSAAPSDALPSHKPSSVKDPSTSSSSASKHSGGIALWPFLVVLAIAAVAATPGGIGALGRSRRRRAAAAGSASAAWAELAAVATDVGLRLPRSLTPRGTARRFGELIGPGDPGASAALSRVLGSLERSAYAPAGSTGTTVSAADLQSVRRAIVSRRDLRDRVRAVALPPSLLAGAREGAAGGATSLTERVSSLVGKALQRLAWRPRG